MKEAQIIITTLTLVSVPVVNEDEKLQKTTLITIFCRLKLFKK